MVSGIAVADDLIVTLLRMVSVSSHVHGPLSNAVQDVSDSLGDADGYDSSTSHEVFLGAFTCVYALGMDVTH